MQAFDVSTPLDPEQVAHLNCGDVVSLSGVVYTARDAAHARFVEALDHGRPLPVDLKGQVVYYAGPTPAPPGRVIGSCGPTTSGRMDRYTPRLIRECGLAGMVGKGPRSLDVVQAMAEAGAVYFAAVGGAAALIAQSVQECQVVAYDDLGPEAVRRLVVDAYPCVVAIDSRGRSIYDEGPAAFRRS